MAEGSTFLMQLGHGGWRRWAFEEVPAEVWSRVKPTSYGRLAIRELYIVVPEDGPPITGRMLRDLPVGRMEAACNDSETISEMLTSMVDKMEELDREFPDVVPLRALLEGLEMTRGELDKRIESQRGGALDLHAFLESRGPGPDLHKAAQYFDFDASTFRTNTPNWVRDMLTRTGDPPAREPWVRREIEHYERTPDMEATVTVPDRRPYPDEFYESVARVYGYYSQRTRSPARVMADANFVPNSTVHRWVKRARELGYLGPGQRGKAG